MRELPLLALVALMGVAACAGPPARGPTPTPSHLAKPSARSAAAGAALAMVGVPYRYGGASPSGFDCSGLVVYSYARAGIVGLPHSSVHLERISRPVGLHEIEPGDLLFFRLSKKRTSHVAIYVGDRAFVHAPSGGKRVERVSVDHTWWSPRLERAGRL